MTPHAQPTRRHQLAAQDVDSADGAAAADGEGRELLLERLSDDERRVLREQLVAMSA